MKTIQFLIIRMKTFFPITLTCLFLFSSLEGFTETVVNFSGKWTLNLSKSDPVKDIISQTDIITQGVNDITFDRNISPNSTIKVSGKTTYILDGEERETSDNEITRRVSAKWSNDKQSITINTILIKSNNGIILETKRTDSYNLINNGKTLMKTTKYFLIKNGISIDDGKETKMVFEKN